MVCKKKFKFKEVDLRDESFVATLHFIEEILRDCRSYLGTSFKEIVDVDLENLGKFLIPILKAFSEGVISASKMGEVGYAIRIYIHRRYLDDFPDTCYPDFGEDHPLSVPLNVLDYIEGGSNYIEGKITHFWIFPEDGAFFIEMLKEPPEKALETNKKIDDFVEQFDTDERFKEGRKRGLFDKW